MPHADCLFKLLQIERLYEIAANPCLHCFLFQRFVAANRHQYRNDLRVPAHQLLQRVQPISVRKAVTTEDNIKRNRLKNRRPFLLRTRQKDLVTFKPFHKIIERLLYDLFLFDDQDVHDVLGKSNIDAKRKSKAKSIEEKKDYFRISMRIQGVAVGEENVSVSSSLLHERGGKIEGLSEKRESEEKCVGRMLI